MSSFDGQVAVVTGAGSGIGRGLALGLARRGSRLALSDVDAAGLSETVRLSGSLGADVHQAELDVSDRLAMQAYADAVADHYGRVNQVYNNAGIAFSRTILDSEYADYERVFAVNLWGVIHGTKAFLPHLIASGAGHVINISSLNGIMAQGEMSHYCTTKFAVRGFTETLRIEMLDAGHRVRVTSVHPGGIKTQIEANATRSARERGQVLSAADEARSRLYSERLLKMSPDEAAEVILEGVAADRPRVLVGNDAKALDLLVRAVPSLYPRVVAAGFRQLMKRG